MRCHIVSVTRRKPGSSNKNARPSEGPSTLANLEAVPQRELNHALLVFMIFNVAPNDLTGHFIPYRWEKVGVTAWSPTPQLLAEPGKVATGFSGGRFEEYVHMVSHNIHGVDDHVVLLGNPLKRQLGVFSYLLGGDSVGVFRNCQEMFRDWL